MGIPVLYQGSLYAPVPFMPIPPPADPAPELVSSEIGTVNAFTLVVTFNENISASNYGTGVTIKVNGTATSITSATRQSNHAIVRYVIPVLWHGSGDTVTWEYDSATGNIVAESGGAALGDVSAQSVTNNCEYAALFDLQADTLALNEGDPVSIWPDQSGIGRDFTQTGTARPTYHSSGGSPTDFGIYPSVSFDGINDYMDGGAGADLDNLDSWTIFQINGYNQERIAKLDNTSSGAGWLIDASGTETFLQDAGGNHWTQFDVDNPLITPPLIACDEIVSKSLSRIYAQGIQQTLIDNSVPPLSDYSSTDHILIGRTTTGGIKSGQFAAIMIFYPPPNVTNRAALETRLGARYGLTVP